MRDQNRYAAIKNNVTSPAHPCSCLSAPWRAPLPPLLVAQRTLTVAAADTLRTSSALRALRCPARTCNAQWHPPAPALPSYNCPRNTVGEAGSIRCRRRNARNRSGPIPLAAQLWRDRYNPAPKGHHAHMRVQTLRQKDRGATAESHAFRPCACAWARLWPAAPCPATLPGPLCHVPEHPVAARA